jgi:tripartite-type tricarboxylate transporter receptor subunit TctC
MKFLLSLTLAISSLVSVSTASAQQPWPNGPVTLVVPFAAGGSSDIAARLLAQQLGTRLNQPFVVVNRPGGTGSIGASAVATARPDGQTFLFGSGSLASSPSLFKSLPYDTANDFVPVTQVTSIASILVVHPSVPARNVREFVDYVKANPGKVNYGSAGSGSLQHVSGALFAQQIGGQMVHVPYKGGAPANADLVAGRIQAVFGPIVELLPFVNAGSVRVLGVTTQKRSSVFPDAPPIAQDVPNYEMGTWHGMFAPKGTPPAIVESMNAAMAATLKEPAVSARLLSLGLEPVGSSVPDFRRFFLSEMDRWKELVRISGAVPE